jgi:WhiB family redox-sensing transcriptional regulator
MCSPDADVFDELERLLSPPDWYARAACRGEGTTVFFPRRSEPLEPAKRLCASCPVADQCLDVALALDYRSDVGIWAGTSRFQRRKMPGAPRDRSHLTNGIKQSLDSSDRPRVLGVLGVLIALAIGVGCLLYIWAQTQGEFRAESRQDDNALWRASRVYSPRRLATVMSIANCPGGLIMHGDGTTAGCTLDEDGDCRGHELRHESAPVRCYQWSPDGCCNHCGIHAQQAR